MTGAAVKSRLRAITVVALVIVAIVGSGFLLSTDEVVIDQFDPESVEPDGTKAMASLVERLGGDFSTGAVGPDDGVGLLLVDTLTQNETVEIENWIESGGTLVVADLGSSLAGGVQVTQPTGAPANLEPRCDLTYASGVNRIRPQPNGLYSTVEPARNAVDESVGCFPVDEGYFLLEQQQGLGRVVVVGGADIFTNNYLADADNAVLVANLLDIGDGGDVVFLETREVGPSGGDSGLTTLLPDRVRNVLWQLVVAGFLLIVWRWRRFGMPVREEQPVEIPASSLVVAVGDLMHAGGREDRAAAILRYDLRRMLGERFGLPRDTSVETLADVASRHTGIDVDIVRDSLIDKTTQDGESLVQLAQRVEHIRNNI